MNSVQIIRDIKSAKQIQGQLFILNENAEIVFHCYTLELPWKKNMQNVSAIPEGEYRAKKRASKKYKKHLHILDVENRSYILVHPANFVRQLRGCVAVGEKRVDIDHDGLDDVTNSVATMEVLLSHLDEETIITISSLK